ncbi:MAG: hypothetical protein QXW32_03070 [Nitrososphaerales archaeon]
MAVDWLTRLGRKGFEALVNDIVEKAVDKALRDRVEPRLSGIENRLAAIESEIRGVRDRLAGMEIRLDVAERLTKLEAEVAALKSSR